MPQHIFAKADTKKQRHASVKPSAFADCQGKFQMLHVGHILCHAIFLHMTTPEELFRSSFELLTETQVQGSNYLF